MSANLDRAYSPFTAPERGDFSSTEWGTPVPAASSNPVS
jgi:hypothetical protein